MAVSSSPLDKCSIAERKLNFGLLRLNTWSLLINSLIITKNSLYKFSKYAESTNLRKLSIVGVLEDREIS